MTTPRPTSTKRALATLAAAALASALMTGTAAAAQAPTAQAHLDRVASTTPQAPVTAIVQFDSSVSKDAAVALAHTEQAQILEQLPLIHGLALRLPAVHAKLLESRKGVSNVTLNVQVRPQSVSPSLLQTTYPRTAGADRFWTYDRPYTGKGVGVAVIDTGVAGNLVDFKNADGSSRVVANVVANANATSAGDTQGHGTHVAGIIAGNSGNRPSTDPLSGDYVGVAPEANIVAVKAADDQGRASVLDVINGLQFVVDHKADYNIRVVNLSVSADTAQSAKTDPLDAAVEAAWFKGIVVVAAAGNRGAGADAVQYAPGNDPYAISVGGVDEQGTSSRWDDKVASWSSTGRTQDGVAKPDVLAPGAHIVSALAPGSMFATTAPGSVVGGAYFRAGGTSMAAPVVSGLAALLIQAHPEWTPNQVKGALVSTGRPVAGTNGVEVQGEQAAYAAGTGLLANLNLTPSTLLAPVSGSADPTLSSWSLSSWSLSSWSQATGGQAAPWALSSWSLSSWSSLQNGTVDPTLSSWSLSSWSSAPGM